MKPHVLRKSLFIPLFIIIFFAWLYITEQNQTLSDIGIDIFSGIAYLAALEWMIHAYKNIKGKQRFFWLFFALGICFLFVSKIASGYQQFSGGKMPHSLWEDILRISGYLCFFAGFIFEIKVIKSTLPMIRFLLNIIIVITTVYSVSWYFIVHPILEGNKDITNIGFYISSINHVVNISLLFASVCLIFMLKHQQRKMSLYLIAAGFFIQVIGDFFYINHVKNVGSWLFLLWPVSALLMGLGAVLAEENPWDAQKDEEKLEYKNYYLTILSAGTLLVFTFWNQENNVLEKGLHLTVILLLAQQMLTTFENKAIFKKLRQLAQTDGTDRSDKQTDDNEMAKLLGKIEKLAHYDPLTELPNRNLFQISMGRELKRAKEKGKRFSLMYIDMDRFKYVNDSLGHDSGDLLLQHVAKRLKDAAGPNAVVARIGGDEFAIILKESETSQLEQIANQILKRFEPAFNISGNELYTTPSIGITIYPEGGRNAGDLLKSADAAMYLAKEEGKNKYKFFNHQLNEQISKKMQVENGLRRGLEDDHFSVYYQPQVDLRTEKIIGFEALIRWSDPELGMVSPVDFIPVAEETGLIEPIGRWVLKTACQQLKEWQQMGMGEVSMSVNASIRQFQNPIFIDDVKMILAETKLDPKYLKIEITESILQNMSKTRKMLDELRDLGIQIAIDDFGTGYSSLSYLKDMPVNCLKIDKAFIDKLSNHDGGPIVKTIIDMGRNMNFTVIAEGVESHEHVSFLRSNQCFVGQGYLFSKPLPASEVKNFLFETASKIS
ncbi:putative bifunctional diguanylate cyclase/phosphodiesterase [Neobacillus sp. Marseille-QA0830]